MSVFLTVASGLFAAASGMLYAAVMPFHAKELGAPAWVVTSLPMGLPSILSLVLLLPIAIFADKTGKRKEILVVALVLTLLANIGLALAGSWVALTLWRLVSGIPFAFMSLFALLIAFMLPADRRGMAVGLGMGGSMLGMGIFQAMSGYLLEVVGGYRGLYYLAAALAGLAILLLLPVRAPVVKSPTGISGRDIAEVLTNRNILWTGFTLCVYLIGWQMMYGSFPIVLTGVLAVPIELQTVFFAVASVMLGFGTFIWGPVIDKIGARKALFAGLMMSTIATFVLKPLSAKMWPYVILFWVATLGGVAGAPGASTVATKSVRLEVATLAMNMTFLFVMLPGIVGGVVAGPLLSGLGVGGMLLVAAIVQLIGAVMTLRVPEM
ncbi:MAG: MFS transporter [Bacillota bacterium]|nr:MFS transporter [Bacillota bacterium]